MSSPQRERQYAGRFWTCGVSLARQLAQKPILFRNFTFGALGCFQWHISAKLPLVNVCEWNLSADTDTWISCQQVEKILHPVKRRGPVMQCAWDSHHVRFIKALSTHSLFQDWWTDGIADFIVVLLQVCWTVLVWSDFCPVHLGSDYPCLPTTPVLLPHAKGVNWGGCYLSDWSLEPGATLTQKNLFGHEGIAWWKMAETLQFYIFHLIIHFSHWNDMTADKELYHRVQNHITGFGNQV